MSINVLKTLTGVFSSFEPANEAVIEREQPPRKLRSRAERITDLLDEAGGYTWQGEIVAALSCSESTTSREPSKMEDAEQITRYRIRKCNVVCLPDREPECFQCELPDPDRVTDTNRGP